jgi:hypothetical protein
MKQYKNTVNTSTHITKTPTHTHTQTLQNPYIQQNLYMSTHSSTWDTDIDVKISECLKVNRSYQ